MSKGSGSSRAGGSRGSAAAQKLNADLRNDSRQIRSDLIDNLGDTESWIASVYKDYEKGTLSESEFYIRASRAEEDIEKYRMDAQKSLVANLSKALDANQGDVADLINSYQEDVNKQYSDTSEYITGLYAKINQRKRGQ